MVIGDKDSKFYAPGYSEDHQNEPDYYTHYDEEYGDDDDDSDMGGSGSGGGEYEVLLVPRFITTPLHLLVTTGHTLSLQCVVDNLGRRTQLVTHVSIVLWSR